MAITLRTNVHASATTKGDDLTWEELDANFTSFLESSGSSLVGFLQSGSGASSSTVETVLRRFVFPEMFGAVGDGVTNDATAFTNALAAIANGGTLMLAPGATYHFTSQVTVTGPDFDRICIQGYGAEITTAGAISGLKITEGTTTGGISVYGLKINHRGNSSATYGFDIVGAWQARLYDCTVEAHGVSASYAAYHLGQTDTSDTSTGSFWWELNGCFCRKRTGGDSGDITTGILIEGSCNAGAIRGGSYNNVTTGLHVKNYTGETALANALTVSTAFEGYTTAVHVEGAATSVIAGMRFITNRFENGTSVFKFTGVTDQPAVEPYMAGNMLTSNAGTYLTNANNLRINTFDFSTTPSIEQDLWTPGMVVHAVGGSAHPFDVWPAGGARGIRVMNSAGSAGAVAISWTGTGNQGRIRSNGNSELALSGVKGVSATAGTDANNLRGQATFATAGTKAVAFGTAEADATFFVVVTGNVDENFWVTSKATTGFTINSSNASSTAVVDWVLIR